MEDIADTMQQASLCALGRTASNPVLSTLRYFREEYLEHIEGQRCPAGICRELSEFWIDPAICTGCGLCLPRCPAEGIKGEKKQAHWIESDKCIRCGECIDSCSFQAIKVK
jgi:NADH-quinone oxidoreductase subunit F